MPVVRTPTTNAPSSRASRSCVACQQRSSSGRMIEAQLTALEAEQEALAVQPAAVARELAVGADDAVAGDDDRDRVRAVRGPDRAGRVRRAHPMRDLAVGDRLAVGDLAQRV